ncbi:hypothetical protein T4C_13161 [Trichinella pseudospiralis]|uniref:Transmembrane protein n=1 Tax=Trichinella pseudospiralis TaxID=6337 RepID=A0A0V1J392_TRIPS|nr:hypothetical protein T4E_5556 [Trichinella pseudospiralis]KRZ29455.1 hypothetical protein T4C_13161 [Trichinella pseudospiralis]
MQSYTFRIVSILLLTYFSFTHLSELEEDFSGSSMKQVFLIMCLRFIYLHTFVFVIQSEHRYSLDDVHNRPDELTYLYMAFILHILGFLFSFVTLPFRGVFIDVAFFCWFVAFCKDATQVVYYLDTATVFVWRKHSVVFFSNYAEASEYAGRTDTVYYKVQWEDLPICIIKRMNNNMLPA